MPLWRSGPNIRALPAILLTLPPSKAADMIHLCFPQNQALGVCRGFVNDIQECGTHGREDLVSATITSNAGEEETEKNRRAIKQTDKHGHKRINIPLQYSPLPPPLPPPPPPAPLPSHQGKKPKPFVSSPQHPHPLHGRICYVTETITRRATTRTVMVFEKAQLSAL